MRKEFGQSIALVFCLAVSSGSMAYAETSSQKCWDQAAAGGQSDLNQCALQDYQTSDAQLNEVYRAIEQKYHGNPAFLAKLKLSEEAWIKYRDAELAMMYPPEPDDNPEDDHLTHYGSIYPMCKSMYLDDITQDRIKELKQWLDVPTERSSCMGSIDDTSPER